MDFADRWNQTDDEDFDPADGTYRVRVEGGEAFESKDGREFCKLELRVLEGDSSGRTFDHFMSLTTPDLLARAKGALRIYGADVSRLRGLEDLEERLEALEGTEAEITVAHRNGFTNVTVHHAVPAGGERGPSVDTTDLGEDGSEEEAEEFPF